MLQPLACCLVPLRPTRSALHLLGHNPIDYYCIFKAHLYLICYEQFMAKRGLKVLASPNAILFYSGWGAGTRTPIARIKISRPAIRRHPKRERRATCPLHGSFRFASSLQFLRCYLMSDCQPTYLHFVAKGYVAIMSFFRVP